MNRNRRGETGGERRELKMREWMIVNEMAEELGYNLFFEINFLVLMIFLPPLFV